MANKTKHKTTISTAITGLLLKYADKNGLETDRLCKIAKIDPAVIKDREARISAKQFRSIWEEAQKASGSSSFGLDFGMEMALNYHSGHILFAVMMNCSTAGDALNKFIQYHNLMGDAIHPELTQKNNSVHLACVNAGADPEIPGHVAEALLCMFIHILRFITDNNINLIAVRFGHTKPADISAHERIFAAPLAFDQTGNELVIEDQFMKHPIFMSNPGLLKTLEQYAHDLLDRLYHADTLSFKVTRILSELMMKSEKPGAESVADKLAMSLRNLQQKLKKEGTNYRSLLDNTRKELALEFLKKGDMTICDITFFLGFSEQSAFNHAFKRWTGVSPKEYFMTGRT